MRNGCHHPSGVITVYVVAPIGRTNAPSCFKTTNKTGKAPAGQHMAIWKQRILPHTHTHTLMLFSAPSPDGGFYRASLQRPLPAEVGGYQFDYEENDTNYLPLFSVVGKNFNKNTSPSSFSTNKDRGCKQVRNDFPTSFMTMG